MLLFDDMETLIGLTLFTNKGYGKNLGVFEPTSQEKKDANFYDMEDITIIPITENPSPLGVGRYSIDDKFRIHDRTICKCKEVTENRVKVKLVDEMGLPIKKALLTFGKWNAGDDSMCLIQGDCIKEYMANV